SDDHTDMLQRDTPLPQFSGDHECHEIKEAVEPYLSVRCQSVADGRLDQASSRPVLNLSYGQTSKFGSSVPGDGNESFLNHPGACRVGKTRGLRHDGTSPLGAGRAAALWHSSPPRQRPGCEDPTQVLTIPPLSGSAPAPPPPGRPEPRRCAGPAG